VAYSPIVPGDLLSRDSVDGYLAAVDWLRGILGRAEVAAVWDEPSAVVHYSVGGVAAHAVHGVQWLEQLLKDAEPVGLQAVTMGEFFGPNRAAAGADGRDSDRGDNEAIEDGGGPGDPFSISLRSAAEDFARTGADVVAAACTASRNALAGLLESAPATRSVPVLRLSGRQVALRDYLRTRVLELVVHGDDVVCSVPGLTVPDPPRSSVQVSLGVCLELAEARVGGLAVLRGFTRAERSQPGVLRVL
jgi:hypothetical protein